MIITSTLLLLFLSLISLTYQENNTLLTYCQAVPLNLIQKCNSTCATCPTSSSLCSACPDYLQLLGSTCAAISGQKLYYSQYFTGISLKTDKKLSMVSTSSGYLSSNQTFTMCINGSYKFDLVGLFDSAAPVAFTMYYPLQAQSISINFKLFFMSSSASVQILVNQKILFSYSYDSGAYVNITTNDTATVIDDIDYYFGVVYSDPTAYLDTFMPTVRTPLMALSDTDAVIKIIVQNGESQVYSSFWGFRDLTIVAKKCNTCVSETIKKFAKVLGIIIAISIGVVAIGLGALYLYSKGKNARYRRRVKRRFQENQAKKLKQQKRNSKRLSAI